MKPSPYFRNMAEEKPPETKTRRSPKYNPPERGYRYLSFQHDKLSEKALDYQHELWHIVYQGLEQTNNKIQRSWAIWQWAMREEAHGSRSHRVLPGQRLEAFVELVYHLQNFGLRVYAYRDKVCRFINLALHLGFRENDRKIWVNIFTNKTVKRTGINSELTKFNQPPLKTIINKRNLLSHNIYYGKECYGLLLPDVSPKDVGARKAISSWRKKVKPEVEQADRALILIFRINKRLVKKILAQYEKELK